MEKTASELLEPGSQVQDAGTAEESNRRGTGRLKRHQSIWIPLYPLYVLYTIQSMEIMDQAIQSSEEYFHIP